METIAMKPAWDALPPMTRNIIKAMIFVGSMAIAYKMGFFSWMGFITFSAVLAVCAMIIFAIADTEHAVRETVWDAFGEIWKAFTKAMNEASDAKSKVS
jgi:hypothetical protein